MTTPRAFKWSSVIGTFIASAVFWALAGGMVWGWDRVVLWALLGALIFTAGDVLRQVLMNSRTHGPRR